MLHTSRTPSTESFRNASNKGTGAGAPGAPGGVPSLEQCTPILGVQGRVLEHRRRCGGGDDVPSRGLGAAVETAEALAPRVLDGQQTFGG
mmetsp:Transcript_45284/g.119661  ORF Transcript_45284/g.119661 Transcript_45284/m.119661 type:complete len:90 (+) Transcript_45284:218-487(+)